MNGLKQTITAYLQIYKRLDLDQLYSLCGRERKKTSNGERRLRELMSPLHKDFNPNIKAEKNAKGAIIAYTWESSLMVKRPFTAVVGSIPTSPTSEKVRIWNEQFKKPEIKVINTLF